MLLGNRVERRLKSIQRSNDSLALPEDWTGIYTQAAHTLTQLTYK